MYVVQSIISYEHVTSFRLAIKGFHNLFEMLHFSPKKKFPQLPDLSKI